MLRHGLSCRKALESTFALFDLQALTLTSIHADGDPSRFDGLPEIPPVEDSLLNAQLNTARQQSQQFLSRFVQIDARLTGRATMKLKEQIAEDIKPLLKAGLCLAINTLCS